MLRNNFRVTKKFLIAKFDFTILLGGPVREVGQLRKIIRQKLHKKSSMPKDFRTFQVTRATPKLKNPLPMPVRTQGNVLIQHKSFIFFSR